jgi:phage gp36-like protein
MPLITPVDLSTHFYPEVINEITRNNDIIITSAINTAVQEAKLYLSRFDLLQLFGTDTTDPEQKDPLLQQLLKDIAAWHLIRLSNPGSDQPTFRMAYDDAIKTLKNIMNGQAVPEGWPYANISSAVPDGDSVTWSSNAKRSNYY